MPINQRRQTAWPRRPNGMRRRASAARILSQGFKISRPASWLLRLGALLVIAVPSLIMTSPGYVAFADNLPQATNVAEGIREDTLIYAPDGKTLLADLHPPGYQAYYEPLSAMGTLLPEAVISIEDRNFYNEPGIDPQGIVRAGMVNLQANAPVEGASTITQQLVKLRLVGNETSLDRKMREALLAFEIERKYTKDQLLEWYLNSVFFANTAWGSAAGAQIYFHKQTKDLDLAQASMLAGIIRGPTLYNPLVDWNSAKARQKTVLDAMIRDEKITATDAAKAFAEDISPPKHMFLPTNTVLAPAFVSYVTSQLINQFGMQARYSGGPRVISTLNWGLQAVAQRDVSQNIANLSLRDALPISLVALDPTTNAIVAMVGSANPTRNGGQYNLAVWPPRNPGSSMKIYTYTAAIASKKFTMTTPIRDSRMVVYAPEKWVPRNYDGRFHGTCQLQVCMGNSLNIPAVKVELSVGVRNVVNMARLMGAAPHQQQGVDANGYPVFTTNDALNTYGPSLTLGGYGETPLQMATGASVLATQGILRLPYAYSLITKQSGALVYKHQVDPGKRVLDARVAFIMQQIMSNDNNRAMIFGRNSLLTLPGRKVAVKTGTSDSFADAWTVGFTPHLVTAVWGGNTDWWMKMTKGSDSYFIAASRWDRFIQDALDALHRPNEWYSQPAGVNPHTGP